MKEHTEDRKPLRIVIVEDDDDSRYALQELLELLGYDVSAAADGVTGLALILAVRPDVALVDLGLPGLNGYQLAAQLRHFPELARTRLVALTGHGPETAVRAIASGFDVQATKPLGLDELDDLLASEKTPASVTVD